MKNLILLLLSILYFNHEISAQQQFSKATAKAHNLGEALLQTSGLPGLSIAVIKDGKIIYAEGFGFADIENKVRVTTKTQFRTASVAKAITATAIGKLLQENKLQPDAVVQKYVPSFAVKNYPVTVRQLAGHIAGMPHYNDSDRQEKRFYPTVADGLTVFAHEPLKAEPGTTYSYSTHGYTLLSAVIEGASGKSYLDYMKQQIFLPLGMLSTGPDLRASPSPTMSTLYNMDGDHVVKEGQPEDPSYKWAGGGLITTPTDLVKMAHGYLNGFLKPAIVDTLFKTQFLKSGTPTLVGIAWRTSQNVDGRMVRDHAGSMGGARSVIAIYPNEKMAIAIMTNAGWNGMIEETAQMIMLPFLSAKASVATIKGTYNLSVTSVGEKTPSNGKIILNGNEGSFTSSAGLKEIKTMPVIHLEANRYAWIRPDGICYLELELKNNILTGRAIAFGSRLDHNPLTNTPFVSFTSVR